jgi:glycosyltransferase involved in cell wall biosynthesis
MSSNTKLCIATGIFPPDTGGPAKFATSFADWANKNAVSLSIVSLTDGDAGKTQFNNASVELISRRSPFLWRFLKTSLFLRRSMLSGAVVLANGLFLETYIASLFIRGANYITKVPGDIVWERARNSGYTQLSIDEFQNSDISLKWRLFRWLFTRSLRKSKAVIVPSLHLESLCVLWGLPRQKVFLISNSVDTKRFSSGNSPKKWDVITVCRLVPWKGVDEIIEICASLSLSLCVVGDGPEKAKLEGLAKSLHIKVDFVGDRTETEVKSFLDQSRCFVLNSTFEATSYALLEARSMSLFCIARRKTGSEEVITHDGDGLLCDESFPLSSALARFRDDTEFVKSASILARKDTTLRFDQNVNFAKIYEQAAG